MESDWKSYGYGWHRDRVCENRKQRMWLGMWLGRMDDAATILHIRCPLGIGHFNSSYLEKIAVMMADDRNSDDPKWYWASAPWITGTKGTKFYFNCLSPSSVSVGRLRLPSRCCPPHLSDAVGRNFTPRSERVTPCQNYLTASTPSLRAGFIFHRVGTLAIQHYHDM